MTAHFSLPFAAFCAALLTASAATTLCAAAAAAEDARPAKHPEIVAHRGESYDAPENTMASYNLAWERHDDVVETDVHLTKDGKLIICHDFNTFRVTGGPRHGGINKVIVDTPAEALRKLDVGKW
jgi:glycerophosphoryl diester phosphodiesterase